MSRFELRHDFRRSSSGCNTEICAEDQFARSQKHFIATYDQDTQLRIHLGLFNDGKRASTCDDHWKRAAARRIDQISRLKYWNVNREMDAFWEFFLSPEMVLSASEAF